jgi:hypothetical protein
MLPHLNDVAFGTEEELESRVLTLLANPQRRQDIAQTQRLDVQDRFSYTAGMQRMIEWIGQLITTEPMVSTGVAA